MSMPKERQFTMRMRPDEWALLDQLAAREQLPAAEIVRRALRFYRDNVEPAKVKATKVRPK